MEFHNVANIFPMMSGEEYKSLLDDIKTNGLIEPIWIFNEKIIDGRNRYKACKELGIEPKLKQYEGTEEKLDQEFSSGPLQFFLINKDKETHEISIEILDSCNKSIFHETYLLSPGTEISSPELGVEPGIYRYEITLDSNFAFEQEVRADHVSESGSSEKLHIYLIDHPEYPLAVGIEST